MVFNPLMRHVSNMVRNTLKIWFYIKDNEEQLCCSQKINKNKNAEIHKDLIEIFMKNIKK